MSNCTDEESYPTLPKVENADLRNRLEMAQDWVNKSADKLEAAEQENAELRRQVNELEAHLATCRRLLENFVQFEFVLPLSLIVEGEKALAKTAGADYAAYIKRLESAAQAVVNDATYDTDGLIPSVQGVFIDNLKSVLEGR